MAIDVLGMSLANGYTKATAAGMGAIKGDKGEKGDPGPKGDPGNDYILTSADKEEIADIVIEDVPVVEANPILSGTEDNLTGLQVDDTKFKVPSGGGDDSTFFGTLDEWDALTPQQKSAYTACAITDDLIMSIPIAEDQEV